MLYAVNNARGGLYGNILTTGERCLYIFSDFQRAWRVAMAQTEDAAVLELEPDEALAMLEDEKVGSRWNRVALNPEPNHVMHKSFSEAIEWVKREYRGLRI